VEGSGPEGVDLPGGAVWIGVSVQPADGAGKACAGRGRAVGVEFCGPDGGPPSGEWLIELHTDWSIAGQATSCAREGTPTFPVGPMMERVLDPDGPSALTHVRLVCRGGPGEKDVAKALRVEPPVVFGAGELALVRVEVRKAPEVRVPPPRIVVLREPEPVGRHPMLAWAPREGPKGGSMARGRGLGAIEDQIRQARDLMTRFVALNPSTDDKNEVDLKLSKCEGLYEAENIVNVPLLTHIASGVCFDQLIEKLQAMISKYTRVPTPRPGGTPSEGLPWYAWAGMGVGAVAVLGFLAWAISPKPQQIQVRKAA
jgi:hypothetical protein